ncbi:MAG: hypothetical protein ABEN55_21740 [Bradymonadaceae bacterium]
MAKRVAHAFHVAGWGTDKTYSDGTLYVTENGAELADGDVGDYAVVVALDARKTQKNSVSFRANPVKRGEAGIASSARTFVLPARDDIVETFLHQQHTTTIGLNEELTAVETSVDIDLSNSTTTTGDLENTVVWVQKEAILLGAYNSTSGEFENCDRGYYGSRAAHHKSGVNVYGDHPQGWDGRRVELLEIDLDTLTTEVRWPGRIVEDTDKEIGTDESGGNVTVPCKDTTADQADVSIRHEPLPPQKAQAFGESGLAIQAREGNDFYVGRLSNTWGIEKPKTAAQKYDPTKGIRWRIGETLCFADQGTLYTQGAMGSPYPKASGDTTFPSVGDVPLHEVFVVSRAFDTADSYHFGTDPVSVTRELDDQPNAYGAVDIASSTKQRYPYHPLAIAMALELSTDASEPTPGEFDIFQAPTWGLNRRNRYADSIVEEAHRLIQRTSHLQIDQLVMGWPASPIEVIRKIDRLLLHPFGFFRCLDARGRMHIKRFRLADVVDLIDASDGAFANLAAPIPDKDGPGLLHFRTGRGGVVDAVELKYDGLPWRKPRSIYYRPGEGDSVDPDDLKGDADFALDLSTISDRSTAIRRAEQTGRLQATQAPKFKVRTESEDVTGADYSTGEYVGLDDLPLEKEQLVAADGNRVNAISADPEFAMLLLGILYDMVDRTWQIDGRMTNFVARQAVQLRAPAAVVIDVGTDSNGDVDRVYVSTTSEFGVAGSDAHEHESGDEVVFHQQSLALRGTGPEVEISNITSSTTTTPNTGETAYEITLASPLSGSDAPQQDDFMRFGRYDSYDNPGHGGRYLTGYGAVHVWLADTHGTLGAGDEREAVYG